MAALEKALDLAAALFRGEEVRRGGTNGNLYEEFEAGTEVYDCVMAIMKKLNLELFEYNDGIYITPGDANRIFGYTNEELKKEIGIKLNRELYLCYFIIYRIMTVFQEGEQGIRIEYVKSEHVIRAVDDALAGIVKELKVLNLNEVEQNSFQEIAYVWEDLPLIQSEETAARASRGSKTGFVKLVFNFMTAQELLAESGGRYYPTERFQALMTQYYEAHKGRLYEILREHTDGEK